jgi:hypothetical protein
MGPCSQKFIAWHLAAATKFIARGSQQNDACAVVLCSGASPSQRRPGVLKEAEFVGAFAIYRKEVRSFTNKQIELVANFVKQPAAVTLDIMKPDFDGWTVLMRRLLEKIAALKPH